MSFHSKSVVAFGQMLNTLAAGIARREPLCGLLDAVKEHFAAEAVVLAYSGPRGVPALAADSVLNADADLDAAARRPAFLRDLAVRFQHIAATEPGAESADDCVLWIFRDRSSPRFDNEEPALAGLAAAQIARTLGLVQRIDEDAVEIGLYADAIARLDIGVMVADASGRVLKSSAVADRLLARRDSLQIQGGRLRAGLACEDRALHAAIRAAGAEGAPPDALPRGLSLTKASGMRSLGLAIAPGKAGTVVIYLRDYESEPRVETDFARQIFDLTPTEAAVTQSLAAGLSLEDTAAAMAISRNTARAHLRSIFSKNGITRQTELVRMVLTSAVMLGGPACLPGDLRA